MPKGVYPGNQNQSKERRKKHSELIKKKWQDPEYRQKLSKAHKGQKAWNKGKKGVQVAWNKGLIGYKAGKEHWTFGKPRKKETRKKISITNQGVKEKNWNGFSIRKKRIRIAQTSKYVNWRKSVFERDNYTCQKYKIRGGKLIAHHIESFHKNKKLIFSLTNGITLSKKAHQEFHKIYGYKNNTRQQLKKFLLSY